MGKRAIRIILFLALTTFLFVFPSKEKETEISKDVTFTKEERSKYTLITASNAEGKRAEFKIFKDGKFYFKGDHGLREFLVEWASQKDSSDV